MSSEAITDRSALELGAAITSRELTCVEVVRAHLDRIDLLDGRYHSLISRRSTDEVIAEAERMDVDLAAGLRHGWMHGLPHAVKDLVDARGLPTTQGFYALADAPVATEDEPFVARIRDAGAVFVGKTNTPEFGLGSHTFNTIAATTGNIADPLRSAGGSSGGAAVAVAAGLVPVADGSDFMGSLRNPPGWNGVLGLRPSAGVVPGRTAERLDSGLSVDGPIARTVSDLAALLATMAGPGVPIDIERPDPSRHPRIGWLDDLCAALPFESGILETCRAAAERWSPDLRPATVDAVGTFAGVDSLWSTWLVTRHEEVGNRLLTNFGDEAVAHMKPEAQWEIEGYRQLTDAQRSTARAARDGLRLSAARLFDEYDLLVLPTAQVWPFPSAQHWPERIGDAVMDTYHRWMEVTTFATLAGLPTMAVPAGTNEEGLHIGLQVIGRPGGDNALLGWAAWAEDRECFTVLPPSSAVNATGDPTLTA